MEQLISLDHEVFVFLNNLGNSNWDKFWLIVTNKLTWIPLYLLLIFLLHRTFSTKQTLYILFLVALMILFADQFANLFKYGFERFRPCHDVTLQGHFRGVDCEHRGRFGFYSAHASNSMALAVFIGLILKTRFKYILTFLVFWAILVGYSRIYVGVHFPGDVFVGFIFGVLTGLLFFYIYQKFLPKVIKRKLSN